MPWKHEYSNKPANTLIPLNTAAWPPLDPAEKHHKSIPAEISTHTKHLVLWSRPTVPQVTSMLHSPLLSQQTPSLRGRLVTLGRWGGRREARVLDRAVGSGREAEVSKTAVSGSGPLGFLCCVTLPHCHFNTCVFLFIYLISFDTAERHFASLIFISTNKLTGQQSETRPCKCCCFHEQNEKKGTGKDCG